MFQQNKKSRLILISLLIILILACGTSAPTAVSNNSPVQPDPALNMYISGSMSSLEPILRSSGVPMNITYRGGVELGLAMDGIDTSNPDIHVFGVDGQYLAQQSSNFRNPYTVAKSYSTVLVTRNLATQMGWVPGNDLYVQNLITAMRTDLVDMGVTSVSQDDFALNFYMDYLKAVVNSGDPLLLSDLTRTDVANAIDLYADNINNTASNIDLLIQEELNFRMNGQSASNLLVVPENTAIAFNQNLVDNGFEPMLVFYVVDATNLKTYILGSARGINDGLTAQYDRLVEHLSSPAIQEQILAMGFRSTGVGMVITNPDPKVFNEDWGIRADQEFVLAGLPKSDVILQVQLDWQTLYKPASFTVYCLDHSGSMNDFNRMDELRDAMSLVLLDDDDHAKKYLLSSGPNDTTVLKPFSSHVEATYKIHGNNATELEWLYTTMIDDHYADGGTALFDCTWEGLDEVYLSARPDQLASVILLTDGDNTGGWNLSSFTTNYKKAGYTTPVYTIVIVNSNDSDMQELAKATNGDVCDGRGSLEQMAHCFLRFRGNN